MALPWEFLIMFCPRIRHAVLAYDEPGTVSGWTRDGCCPQSSKKLPASFVISPWPCTDGRCPQHSTSPLASPKLSCGNSNPHVAQSPGTDIPPQSRVVQPQYQHSQPGLVPCGQQPGKIRRMHGWHSKSPFLGCSWLFHLSVVIPGLHKSRIVNTAPMEVSTAQGCKKMPECDLYWSLFPLWRYHHTHQSVQWIPSLQLARSVPRVLRRFLIVASTPSM